MKLKQRQNICHVIVNASSIVQHETCQCECKIIVSGKKIIVGILVHVFVRIASI